MAISVVCGGCKAKYSVADSLVGKRVKCQKCGTSFQVPQPEEDLPVLEPVEASEGLKPLSGFDNNDLFGSSSMALDSSNPFDMPAKPLGAMPAYGTSGFAAPAPSPLGYAQAQTGPSTGASVATAIFAPILAFGIGLVTFVLLICSSNTIGALLLLAGGVVTCIACLVLGVMRKPGIAWIACGVYGVLCLLGVGKVGMDIAFHVGRSRDALAEAQRREAERTQFQPPNWNPSPVPPPPGSFTSPSAPTGNSPSTPQASQSPPADRSHSGWSSPPPNSNAQFAPQFDDWRVQPDELQEWAKVGEGAPLTISIFALQHEGIKIPHGLGRAMAISHRVGNKDTLDIWDLGARKKVGSLIGRNEFNRDFTLSPDGKFIAGTTRRDINNKIEVWSVEKRALVTTLDVPRKKPHATVYFEFASPTSLVTLSGEYHYSDVRTWDVTSGQETGNATAQHTTSRVEDMVFSAGRRYLVQESDGGLVFWDLKSMEVAGTIRFPQSISWKGCAFSPNGMEMLLVYEMSGKLHKVCCSLAGHNIRYHWVADSSSERLHHDYGDLTRCGWLLSDEGWLVGRNVVAQKDGSVKWQIPKDMVSGGSAVLFDSNQLLTQSKVKNQGNESLVLELKPFPYETMDRAIAAVQAGGTELDAQLPPLAKGDWSQVKELTLGSTSEWNFVPVARLPLKPGAGNKPIVLSTNRVQNLVFSDPPAAQAVIVDIDPTSPQGELLSPSVRSRVVRFDLHTGKAVAEAKVPGGSELMAVSPSGLQAILNIGREGGRLDLYSLGDTPEQVTAWRPYIDQPAGDFSDWTGKLNTPQTVSWAGFLDEHRLLTMNRTDGQLVLWKLPERQAIYRIPTGSKARAAALAPDRTHVVIQVGRSVKFLKTENGELVGELLLPFDPAVSVDHDSSLAFSADGTRLACVVGDVMGSFLVAFDLKTGKSIAEIPAARQSYGMRAQWAGERQLLTFDTRDVGLLDLERRVVAWRYQIQSGVKLPTSPDNRIWMIADAQGDSDKVLVAQPFQPTAEMQRAIAALPLNPTPIFGPGQSVSIDLAGINGAFGNTDLGERTKAQLTSYLQARNVKVVDGAPIRIVGSISAGKSETQEYQVIRFGPGGGGPSKFSATHTQHNLQMQLVDNAGKVLWEVKSMSSYGGGGGASIPNDQSGQQYLADQEQAAHKRMVEGFFLSQRLPYMILPQPKDEHGNFGLGYTSIPLGEYSRPRRDNNGPARPAPPPAAKLASFDMYKKLLDAERASWIEHWKWCPELDRPIIGLRWGIGVQMDVSGSRAKEDLEPVAASTSSVRSLERVVGPIGSELVETLRSRTAEGKFGSFVGSTEKDLREITLLGAGEPGQISAAARKAMVDLVLLIKIDSVNSGKLKDSRMQLRIIDMASTKKLWESEFLLSSKVAEAKIRGKDPTVTLLNAATEYMDTKMVLQPIDALTRDKALERASVGTFHRANPLASVCEVMLYETRDLITPDIATTAYTKVLSNVADAASLAGNDLAARQTVIKKYLNTWQNNPR